MTVKVEGNTQTIYTQPWLPGNPDGYVRLHDDTYDQAWPKKALTAVRHEVIGSVTIVQWDRHVSSDNSDVWYRAANHITLSMDQLREVVGIAETVP